MDAERLLDEVEQRCLFEIRQGGVAVTPAQYVGSALRERLLEEMTGNEDAYARITKLEEKLEEAKGQREHDEEQVSEIRSALSDVFDGPRLKDLERSLSEVEIGRLSFADLAAEILSNARDFGTKAQAEAETKADDLAVKVDSLNEELTTKNPSAAKHAAELAKAKSATAAQIQKLAAQVGDLKALAEQAQAAARSNEERLAPAMEEIARLRTELETARGLVLQVQEAPASPTKKPRIARAPRVPKAPKELPLWDMFVELSASQGAGK